LAPLHHGTITKIDVSQIPTVFFNPLKNFPDLLSISVPSTAMNKRIFGRYSVNAEGWF
jgi:hypothetical protein